MAKNNQNNQEEAAVEAPAAEAPKSDNRSIVLNLDAKHAELVGVEAGTEMKRTDYIRTRWGQRNATRGEIAKELTALQKKPVPYQIVFAATKGLDGGKPKEAPAAAAAAPEATEEAGE